MTMPTLKSGLRKRVYLGGWLLQTGPAVFEPTTEDAKDTARLADGTLDTSYAAPYVGAPDRVTKHDWTLTFEDPARADLRLLRMLTAYAGSMDFCPWIAEAERWQLPDTSAIAQRRNAVDVIDAGDVPAGTWTAACFGDSGTEYAVTWGTPDSTAPWRHPWAPDAMGSEEPAWLVYYPVYRVEIVSYTLGIQPATREIWTLRLKEV